MVGGKFTVPTDRGGSYRERRFSWVVDSWVKEDEHTPENRPLHYTHESESPNAGRGEKLNPSELNTISEMYVRIESDAPGREPDYRFMAGPFFSISEIDKFLREVYEYGSPR